MAFSNQEFEIMFNDFNEIREKFIKVLECIFCRLNGIFNKDLRIENLKESDIFNCYIEYQKCCFDIVSFTSNNNITFRNTVITFAINFFVVTITILAGINISKIIDYKICDLVKSLLIIIVFVSIASYLCSIIFNKVLLKDIKIDYKKIRDDKIITIKLLFIKYIIENYYL